jgi:hypothetical protein
MVVAMGLNVALSATIAFWDTCVAIDGMAQCGDLQARAGNTGFTIPDLFSRLLADMVSRYE